MLDVMVKQCQWIYRFSTRETSISFNAVERLQPRTRDEPALCPVNQKGKHWSEYSSLTLRNEWYVVLQFYSTSHFHISCLSFSQRAASVSEYISQFGLAPHFRQVPVGIYNTFRTRSSLSAALTLNASTTYLTDIFFFLLDISQIVAYLKLDDTHIK